MDRVNDLVMTSEDRLLLKLTEAYELLKNINGLIPCENYFKALMALNEAALRLEQEKTERAHKENMGVMN